MARRRSNGRGIQKNIAGAVAGALLGLVATTSAPGRSRARTKKKIHAESRFKRPQDNRAIPIEFVVVALIAFVLAWVGNTPMRITAVMIVACMLAVWWIKRQSDWQRIFSVDLDVVDKMTGHDFERYVGQLLAYQGYRTEVTKGTGDNGVDIIAEFNGVRWAIQCKRQVGNVARNAISDAVAATHSTLFNCSRAMVVTNGYYSRAAVQYGKSTDCVLVDRDTLSNWIGALKKNSANQNA